MNTDVHEYVSKSKRSCTVHIISPRGPGILLYRQYAVFHLSRWGLERINLNKRGFTVLLGLLSACIGFFVCECTPKSTAYKDRAVYITPKEKKGRI